MITIKEININDNGEDSFSPNDILLTNYYKLKKNTPKNISVTDFSLSEIHNPNNLQNYSLLQNVVVNFRDVFDNFNQIGNTIFERIEEQQKDSFKLNDTINDIFINEDLKKEIINICINWINENGFPYIIKETSQPYITTFLNDVLILHIFYQINKLMIKINQINNDKLEENSSKKKHIDKYIKELNSLFSIVKDDITESLLSYNNPFLQNNNKSKINSYTYLKSKLLNYNNKEEYFKHLKLALISYTDSIICNNGLEYSISKQVPIYIKSKDAYKLYYRANSLIGIAYDQLLNILMINTLGLNRQLCDNPECMNEFVKYGKSICCDTCKENGFLEKRKRQRYEQKTDRNEQNKERTIAKKNWQKIQELVKVNHVSEELMKEVNDFEEKKHIGYNDRSILEELYKKIKDSLNT